MMLDGVDHKTDSTELCPCESDKRGGESIENLKMFYKDGYGREWTDGMSKKQNIHEDLFP